MNRRLGERLPILDPKWKLPISCAMPARRSGAKLCAQKQGTTEIVRRSLARMLLVALLAPLP